MDQDDRAAHRPTGSKRAATVYDEALAEQRAYDPDRIGPVTAPVLGATVVRTSELLPESARKREVLAFAGQLVRWKDTPRLDPRERTVWSSWDPPLEVDGPAAVSPIRSLKLKGVGVGTAEGPRQPSGDRYQDNLGHAHVGFDDSGDFTLLYSEPAPLGGMFLRRAEMEFANAERLVRAGCPSIVPIALYRYETLGCDWRPGSPLGVPVCGGPSSVPLRAAGLFIADPEDTDVYGQACAALLRLWGPDRGTALGRVAEQCARTLRQFHEAGLYRYNSSPTNYLLDPSTERICMVDLDSSLGLETCASSRRALEVLRDVAGGIFNLGMVTLLPSVSDRFPPSELARVDHFRRFAQAYFPDVEVPREALTGFLDHFFTAAERIRSRKQEILESADGDRLLRELWIERTFCYATLIAGLAESYHRSALHRRYPLEFTPGEVTARAETFLSTRPTAEW